MNTSEVKVGSTIAQQFSRSAASYRKESRVQMFLEQEVLARVICHSSGMPNGVKFLDLGSGTGSLAAAIAKSHPASQIDAVDIADKMIQLAKNEYSESKNIYWHCVDFRQAALAGKYDMICSNATLQWIMPLEHTFTKIRSLLAKNGRLVFSIILKGSLQEITQARDLAAPHKTPIVRLPSMDEVFAAVVKRMGWFDHLPFAGL